MKLPSRLFEMLVITAVLALMLARSWCVYERYVTTTEKETSIEARWRTAAEAPAPDRIATSTAWADQPMMPPCEDLPTIEHIFDDARLVSKLRVYCLTSQNADGGAITETCYAERSDGRTCLLRAWGTPEKR